MGVRSSAGIRIDIAVLAGILAILIGRSVQAQNARYRPETEHLIPSLEGDPREADLGPIFSQLTDDRTMERSAFTI
jgi:hypothetical protein